MFRTERYVGIDLGTGYTSICLENSGIVLKEPSLIALEKKSNKVVAFGEEARKLQEQMLDNVTFFKPIKNGIIADTDLTLAMVKHFFRKISKKERIGRPTIVASINSGATSVDRQVLKYFCSLLDAKKVFLAEKSMCAAIGSDLPVTEPYGSLVIDFGAGKTEISLISFGGIIHGQVIYTGGDMIDTMIGRYIKSCYHLEVNEYVTEKVKVSIGSVANLEKDEKIIVHGIDTNGNRGSATISSIELRETLLYMLLPLLREIKWIIREASPEIVEDIFSSGIKFVGGNSQLRGMEQLFTRELGVKISVPENAAYAVPLGLTRIIRKISMSNAASFYTTKGIALSSVISS